MGRTRQHMPGAPCLTPELWAKVFAHLEESPEVANIWDYELQQQNQAQMHQLKLVCKEFGEVCASHTELVQRLYVSGDFSVSSLPSLLAWLRQSKNSLTIFTASCEGQLVHAVLAGLVASQLNIRAVGCTLDAFSIPLVAGFANLEECAIWHSREQLDLAPLGSLPHLNHVVLHGEFQQLYHLAGLTRLDCSGADVSGVRKFAPTLQHLEIDHSNMREVHPQGLSACTALTQLVLKNALMTDNSEAIYLNHSLSLASTDLGGLTRLHTLKLGSNVQNIPSVEWISGLTSLKDLSICGRSSLDGVVQHASVLTQLTRLDISAPFEFEMSILDIDMEWHRLKALQDLSINNVVLRFGPGVAGLLQLQHLKQVSFTGNRTLGEADNEYLCALVFNLARLRPQVKLLFDNGELQNFFVQPS
ncbi:hypothetical protein ABBQ32_012549 [Trebouxia sp. C0010 RCD-2024]